MIKKIPYSDKADWLAKRRQLGIGGSDAAAVAGMSRYNGAYGVWLEKTGRAQGFDGNLTTEVGAYLEDLVAKLFERETGKKVRRENFILTNDRYPFAFADIDRKVIGEDAILECKTTNNLENMRKFKQGEYPAEWYCQLTQYLAVTGAERAYLAVLIGCREFRIFTLERSEEEIEALMRIEERFYAHVKDDTPPEAMAADSETVEDIYRDCETIPEDMDFTPDLELLQDYDAALEREKEAKAAVDELKARICQRLGVYESGSAGGYRVTWKTSKRQTFDTKKFKADNPNIDLKPWYRESTARIFYFKAAKTAE